MQTTHILVIGGSASGIVAAKTAKAFHPNKDVLLVRREPEALTPCGIPYIFGTLEGSEQDLISNAAVTANGVRMLIGEVVELDPEQRFCRLASGEEIGFEKLVLALGSTPKLPKAIAGCGLGNVFTISKDKVFLDEMCNRLAEISRVAIVGGGFIGVEVADELHKAGKQVTLLERLPHILELAFDIELTVKAEELLAQRGVSVRTSTRVEALIGEGRVSGVKLHGGETLETEAVIVAVGYQPTTGLAEKAGLELNRLGFIKVNEYMMTENRNIFAVGDCAEKKSFVTREPINVMLASTACAEARIAALNLYRLSAVKTFGGTIAIYSTALGDVAFGVAGERESYARERGFDIVTGTFAGVDKHPAQMPGVQPQLVKLIVARESGVIIGGQVMGGASTGELTNLIGFIIQNRMTINSILTAQIGTHPLLTAPPTAYPLIKAAEAIALASRSGD